MHDSRRQDRHKLEEVLVGFYWCPIWRKIRQSDVRQDYGSHLSEIQEISEGVLGSLHGIRERKHLFPWLELRPWKIIENSTNPSWGSSLLESDVPPKRQHLQYLCS